MLPTKNLTVSGESGDGKYYATTLCSRGNNGSGSNAATQMRGSILITT